MITPTDRHEPFEFHCHGRWFGERNVTVSLRRHHSFEDTCS